jgi:LysR family transcriptional regulator, transcriptional activator of nhaA
MSQQALNYRHLYYFWVVAKAGGMAKAAAQLGMAIQTVSAQVRALEQALGHALLKPAGRGLALTEAGEAALRQAEQIFQLGEQLPVMVREAAQSPVVRLAVGVADCLPKLVVWRLMLPALQTPPFRLLCHVDEVHDLLGDLALHRLDVVLADRPPPPNPNLRLYSHALGSSGVSWYGTPAWASRARRGFPQSLAEVPVLLPTGHAAVRPALDQWFERQGVRPQVVGEFEDSALLKTAGSHGLGIFPAADLVHDDLLQHYQVRRIAACEGVQEHFYAIGAEKKLLHPLVRRTW